MEGERASEKEEGRSETIMGWIQEDQPSEIG